MSTTAGSVDLPEAPQPEPTATPKASGSNVSGSQAQIVPPPPGAAEGEGDKAQSPPGTEEDGAKKAEEGGEMDVRPSKDIVQSDSRRSQRPEEFSAKRHRKASMFEEKGDNAKNGDGGDLRDTLAEFFSSAPREATEAGTVLKPLRRPKLIYENTYRMSAKFPFSHSRVKSMMGPILEDMLMDYKYNSKTSAQKAMEVAEKIRRNVLAFRFDRYKIVVLVTISPLNRQGFHNGFRCLWDANRDSYAYETLRNPSTFVIAVVYGIYFE